MTDRDISSVRPNHACLARSVRSGCGHQPGSHLCPTCIRWVEDVFREHRYIADLAQHWAGMAKCVTPEAAQFYVRFATDLLRALEGRPDNVV